MRNLTLLLAVIVLYGLMLIFGANVLAAKTVPTLNAAVLDCHDDGNSDDASRTVWCDKDENGDDASRTVWCDKDENGDDANRTVWCDKDENGDNASRTLDCHEDDDSGDDAG